MHSIHLTNEDIYVMLPIAIVFHTDILPHVPIIQPSITGIWQAAISKLRYTESVHIS